MALVKQSDTLVLLLTENVLTRPWCLVELYTALKHAVPVVTVEITKRGYGYDFGQAGPYLAGLPGTLEAANPGATEVGGVGWWGGSGVAAVITVYDSIGCTCVCHLTSRVR